MIFDIFYFLMLARIILSFLSTVTNTQGSFLGQFVRFVYWLTEPILSPLRSIIPPVRMGSGAYLDLSPLIVLLLLGFLRRAIFYV